MMTPFRFALHMIEPSGASCPIEVRDVASMLNRRNQLRIVEELTTKAAMDGDEPATLVDGAR